ncbi:hypothetical protein [Streptomyces sp. NPDC050535]|uniref:hypothetical protein n=1 Tax=Streptomyces sp. NPDC050535 TaxID=3365626 RepID=UPI0037A881C5
MADPTAEQLQELRDQLRAEIREAHGTLKDLRAEIKTARELVPLLTDEAFSAEVAKQLGQLEEVTKDAMDTSVARVTATFDQLRDVLLGQDRQSRRRGRTPIPDLLRGHPPVEADRE